MTELDTPQSSPPDDPPVTGGHPSLWRLVSFAAVVTTVVFALIGILQARADGDVEELDDEGAVGIDSTVVTLGTLGAEPRGELLALGLDPTDYTVPFEGDRTVVSIPDGTPALIAFSDPEGDLSGLALIDGAIDEAAVEISADSTARALLVLTPALLQADIGIAMSQVDVIATDPAFDKLVEALAVDSDLTNENPGVETALAEILDRVPNRVPFVDQGCDSVADPRAYAAAGTCVQPDGDDVIISNEQDRWALLYANETGELCGTLSPSGTVGSEIRVGADSCGESASLVAPGPIVDSAAGEQLSVTRIRSAAALELFATYVAPFTELAGGAAGFGPVTEQRSEGRITTIIGALDAIRDAEPGFVAAIDTLVEVASPITRHRAGIDAVAAALASPQTSELFPARVEATGYGELLAFYERAGARMLDDRTDWRWTADSIGDISLTGGGT